MALTAEQIRQLDAHWSRVIMTIHPTITEIPKGGADSVESLLSTWRGPLVKPTAEQVEDVLLNTVLPAIRAAEQQEQAEADKVATAKVEAANIPGWATWSNDEVQAWIDANVQPELQTVAPKTLQMLRSMGRLIVYLRDAEWPNLGGN